LIRSWQISRRMTFVSGADIEARLAARESNTT
jgi:hypothetical protein